MRLLAALACVSLLARGTADRVELESQLSKAYAAARAKAPDPNALSASQEAWTKRRDACLDRTDAERCVATSYRLRIAELQARYDLVKSQGPVRFACPGGPKASTSLMFYETDPSTLIAVRADESHLLFGVPWGSGVEYRGDDVALWWHHDVATISWSRGAPTKCSREPVGTNE